MPIDQAIEADDVVGVAVPLARPRTASIVTFTGWWRAKPCTAPFIVSIGTQALER